MWYSGVLGELTRGVFGGERGSIREKNALDRSNWLVLGFGDYKNYILGMYVGI